MKQHGRWCRVLAALLLVIVLLGAGMVSAEPVQRGSFILSAVGNGEVIIAPERVYYEPGQTVWQALEATKHTFTMGSDGFITAIDGKTAQFLRSDQDGGYALDVFASTVEYFCFADYGETAKPSEARQALMAAMADYLEKPDDVKKAAEAAYHRALGQYAGVVETGFAQCKADLENAIRAYEDELNGQSFWVTFSGHDGKTVKAVNANGRVYADQDGDGVLALPKGDYTFTVEKNGRRVSGSISVAEAITVSAALPEGEWLNQDTAQFSGDYDADFDSNTFPASWSGATCTIKVPDTFSGSVYTYLEHTCGEGNAPQVEMLYTTADGKQKVLTGAFQSKKIGPDKLLAVGAVGNEVTLRLSRLGSDGYTQSMDYLLKFDRTPTLKGLTVTDQDGVLQAANQAFSPNVTQYTYRVINSVKSVTVKPQALAAGYEVTVNGNPLEDGVAVVPLAASETTSITVRVSGGTYETAYTLTLEPCDDVRVTISVEKGLKVQVFNQYDEELGYSRLRGEEEDKYQYQLVKDAEYTYLVTKNQWYHATNTFTADKQKTIQVSVPTEDWLTDLALGSYASGKHTIPLEQTFAPALHSYTALYSDQSAAVCVWAASSTGDLTAHYKKISNSENKDKVEAWEKLGNGDQPGQLISNFLMAKSGYGNTVTVRVTKAPEVPGGITYYQDYEIAVRRRLSLKTLEIACGGENVLLGRTNSTKSGYDQSITDYEITIPAAATTVELTAGVHSTTTYRYGDEGHGYAVAVQGKPVTSGSAVSVPMDGTSAPETITVTVTNQYAPGNETVITIHVKKAAPLNTVVKLQPADALLAVYEMRSGNRIWPENGVYPLSEGFTYEYLLTSSGYVGKSGQMTVAAQENGSLTLTVDDTVYTPVETDGNLTAKLTMTLTQAETNNSLNQSLEALWPSFRGNGNHNGVVNVKTPVLAESSTLYWASRIGESFGADAVSSPILVNGELIVYSGQQLCRVDKTTGEIIKSGQMANTSAYTIIPPAYADGMIFVGLKDGRVQAFDAVTLESLWIYQDPLAGQPNSNLVIYDGYLYTGFWNSETATANFVCLPIADENPNADNESKTAAWRWSQKGGFYWGGAYVCKDYLLIGTDDGQSSASSKTSSLLLLEPKTGKLLDRWDNLDGDIRCAICHDEATNGFYFTSKGGYFYGVSVKAQDGSWVLDGKWKVELKNGTTTTAMSTSTPVVSNGRAYVGVCGSSQFKDYTGHNISVIDLENRMIAYRVDTQGYPQSSGLLTTAYNGVNYVYFLDNTIPGKLRLLHDQPGQTTASLITVEEDTAGQSINQAYALFTPVGAQAEHCISSPIADENGVLYFINDSGHLMAFGPPVKQLAVTKQPEQTTYLEEQSFNATGMEVMATLENGATVDVTRCVTWSTEPLTQADQNVTISYPLLYHNAPGDGGTMLAGQKTATPTVEVAITVRTSGEPATAMTGATVENGTVTVQFNGSVSASWQILAAAYDANGRLVAVGQGTGAGSTATVQLDTAKAARIRVFVLDSQHRPIMKSLEKGLDT